MVGPWPTYGGSTANQVTPSVMTLHDTLLLLWSYLRVECITVSLTANTDAEIALAHIWRIRKRDRFGAYENRLGLCLSAAYVSKCLGRRHRIWAGSVDWQFRSRTDLFSFI